MAGEVMATYHWSREYTLYRIDFSILIWWYDMARHRNYGTPLPGRFDAAEEEKKIADKFIWNDARNRFEHRRH